MPIEPQPKRNSTLEFERQLLRAMCSHRVSREQIITSIGRLANYVWILPEHATVFHAICRAIRLDHTSWRELLPAQATLMGFPDVQWLEYFAADSNEAASLDELVSRLTR